MKYLDPKADLTFKRVFGEHPDLMKSLLNSLLPFYTEKEMIQTVVYLQAEQVPENPGKKNSIVDVKCTDGNGRIFIVEMQMIWSEAFKQRVLFNASKAYVKQLDRHENYELLQPVYSLNIVNEIFEPDLDEYIHYYNIVHTEHSDHIIEGMHFVFVELPKFKPHNFSERKMQVLWLRFLTEINEKTDEVPADLLENPDTRMALDLLRESAFSSEQKEDYDNFWDAVRVEKTLYAGGYSKGKKDGIEEGIAEGRAEGREEGRAEGREEGAKSKSLEIARNLKQLGVSSDKISDATGLTEDEIASI